MNDTSDARAGRRIECSTQPFGTPTYKWLPAKPKLNSTFLPFYSQLRDSIAWPMSGWEMAKSALSTRVAGRRHIQGGYRFTVECTT